MPAAPAAPAAHPPAATGRKTRQSWSSALPDSLEQRLDLLVRNLNTAEIAEKSIDMVKEIKELHAILRAIREAAAPDRPQHLVVVWGGPERPGGPCGSSSSASGGRLARAGKAP